MKNHMLACAALASVAATCAPAQERVTFDYWYGLSGRLGETIQATCDRFNASQDKYEINCVGQSGYANAVQNTIAAFRAGKHPTIVQAYDAGTADLLMSGEFYPVHQMMDDFGIAVDWDDYFPGIANYYANSKGEMVAMPFNSSTPVMYYNARDLAAADIAVPQTWEEFGAALVALKEANPERCAYGYSPSSWVDMEQFSYAHGVPIATNNNGFDGLDAEYVYNTTVVVDHVQDIKDWYDAGLLEIKTNAGGMNARSAFGQDVCSFYFGSIASHASVHAAAVDSLDWDVAMIPVFEGTARQNTVIGGAALWVLSNKSEAEYRGAAEYLNFLATPDSALFWSTETGYIPVTLSGYDRMLETGFYDAAPFKGRETAIASLTHTEVTPLSRGVRIGGFLQGRSEWTAMMQEILSGQIGVQEGLDQTVAEMNKIARNFERTYRGASFP